MLKENMKELAGDSRGCLDGLPNNRAEGPFAFEYNGNFYLTYRYVRQETEVLAYAMSKNPLGPYKYMGLIMAEHANGCWTNHHSIINYKDQWYLFYHHNAFSPNDDKHRSVQIEKLYFNADGTIQEVKETMRGVGINQATEKIEIDRYSSASEDVKQLSLMKRILSSVLKKLFLLKTVGSNIMMLILNVSKMAILL